MLVSAARYFEITHDDSVNDEDAERYLSDAQGLLEERLSRPLELDTYTETLPVDRFGRVYPTVTPLVSSSSGDIVDDYTLGNAVTVSDFFWVDRDAVSLVTYVAGFDEDTVPRTIERAIAKGAKELAEAESSLIPSGATSVRLGDAAISFGSASGGTELAAFNDPTLKRWRRKSV